MTSEAGHVATRPLYLAGPMSGIPQFNFSAFEQAAAVLRAHGFDVSSPHENDPPEVQAAAWASPDGKLDEHDALAGQTWGDCLARAVRHVANDVAGVVLLPAWEGSRGARLEAFTALLCGKPVYELVCCAPLCITYLSPHDLKQMLAR